MDGEGVLGPLLNPWKVHLVDIDHYLIPQYLNTKMNEALLDDPRLPPLVSQWSMTTRKRTQDDPWLFRDFRNAETGECLNSDPRMLPDTLRARGIQLEKFQLI